MDLYDYTTAILNAIVSNSYYGMPKGQIHTNLPPPPPSATSFPELFPLNLGGVGKDTGLFPLLPNLKGKALGTRLAPLSIPTGLNNVCACARSHGSRCRQRTGHHNKPRKNGKRIVWCPVYAWLKGSATLKTVERNFYTSSLDHWSAHTFLYTGV